MAGSYRRMLQLLEKWPVDKNKTGKDLGEYLRTEIQAAFAARKFDGNQEECDRKYLALKRIAEDYHLSAYRRQSTSSATGLSADHCNQVLRDEFLKELEKEDQGIFRKLFNFASKK